MKIFKTLTSAESFAASRREAARALGNEEEVRLWRYLRENCVFVNKTGQVYRFEDSLKALAPTEFPETPTALADEEGSLARSAAELLLKLASEALESKEKQQVFILTALLEFIAGTSQTEEVEDFFTHEREYAHLAVKYFASSSEAEAWLKGSEEQLSPVHILIGDEYYQFWYSRESNTRGMYRDYVIEPIIELLTARGIPPGTPAFATRAEAEEWLRGPPPASEVFVVIAGEYCFAVYQKRLKRHTLHPVATALKEWEEQKQTLQREQTLEATPQPEEGDE